MEKIYFLIYIRVNSCVFVDKKDKDCGGGDVRKYYSRRSKSNFSINLDQLLELFKSVYQDFESKSYFCELLGFSCVDSGFLPGIAGKDINGFFLRKLRKNNLFPIEENYMAYNEDILFDIIELLYDYVSFPLEGFFHSHDGCGMHYEKFDKIKGQQDFTKEINEILDGYSTGFELSYTGEIVHKEEEGLKEIFNSDIPSLDEKNINTKMKNAISRFINRHSSFEERRIAVRELADILEYIKPQIKEKFLKNDEKDLFNIANNFCIRHHSEQQKSDYDIKWLTWVFYLYLDTIHLCLRLVDENKTS